MTQAQGIVVEYRTDDGPGLKSLVLISTQEKMVMVEKLMLVKEI